MIDACFVYIRLISGAQFKAVGKLNQIRSRRSFQPEYYISISIANYGLGNLYLVIVNLQKMNIAVTMIFDLWADVYFRDETCSSGIDPVTVKTHHLPGFEFAIAKWKRTTTKNSTRSQDIRIAISVQYTKYKTRVCNSFKTPEVVDA